MGKPKDDPANHDPFVQGGEHGFIGKPVCSYNVIFDDEEQLKNFYSIVRSHKKRYPEVRTIGGRISNSLNEEYLPKLVEAEQKTIDKPKRKKDTTKHDETSITTTDSHA
jgi:hypothetical protein